jgi:predicted O-methyltransferase YrrM
VSGALIWQLLRLHNRHRIHSPYVYRLLTGFLLRKPAADLRPIRQLHRQLRQRNDTLWLQGYGAQAASRTVTIGQLARRSATGPRKGRLLHQLARHVQPQAMLELGTNLGLGTAYLASAAPSATLYSWEGEAQLAGLARQHLQLLGYTAQVQQGSFLQRFAQLQQHPMPPLQLVYLDGDHRYQPTLDYVEALLPLLDTEAVLVLDDLYWSREMTRAWRALQHHPAFPLSIDLFRLGVLVKRDQARQHFRLWVG